MIWWVIDYPGWLYGMWVDTMAWMEWWVQSRCLYGIGMRGRCALIGGDPNGEIFMLLVLVMATYVNTPIITLREAILNCSHLSNPKWSNLGIWVSCEIMHPLFYKAHTSLSIGHTDDSTLFPCAPAFSCRFPFPEQKGHNHLPFYCCTNIFSWLDISTVPYFHDVLYVIKLQLQVKWWTVWLFIPLKKIESMA